MKKIVLILICCFLCYCSIGQVAPDSTAPRQDTPVVKRDTSRAKKDTSVVKKKDTAKQVRPDSAARHDTTARAVRRDTTTRIPVVPRPSLPKPADTVVKAQPPPPPKAASDTQKPDIAINGELLPGVSTDSTGPAHRLAMFLAVLKDHPYYNFFGEPIVMTVQVKKVNGRETMFYFLAGLLIYYGFIRLLFGKYIANLTTLFFRVTMRQQQIREQLLQSPLPSLLLNLLFFINGGFFLSFVAMHYQLVPLTNQWILMGWCAALLVAIYVGKLIIMKMTGWIFNIGKVTDMYIFIVYLVNKMIGIFLLPVLVVLAFAGPVLFKVVLTLTFVILVIFLLYRFIIAYNPIRNEIKVNRFHFFIYLCAFEIAPLLLIYKVLLIFVERSY